MPGLTRSSGRRVQPLTWLGIALLVLLVTVDAVIWFSRSDDDAFASSASLDTSRKPTRAADSARGQPSDKPGNYVSSWVTSDGRLVTDHYLVTAEPVSSVQLKMRTTGYPDFAPSVEQLKVFADDERLSSAPIPTVQALKRVRLGQPSTVIHLHYVTSGAVVASVPSSSGRALALTNPVKVRAEAPAGRHVVEVDGQVLGLSCASGREVAEPCGEPSGADVWKVTQNRDKSAVLAQVNTPS